MTLRTLSLTATLCAATLIVAASILVRAGAIPAFAGATADEPPRPTVLGANDDEKSAILKSLEAATLEKDQDAIAAAITKMVERKHADFVPIIRKAIDSADAGVAAAAIRAAASADLKDEAKRIRKLLKAKPKDKDTRIPGEVPAACIDYLGRLGIGGDEEAILEDHAIPFVGDERRLKRDWAVSMQQSTLYYFGKMKYKPAAAFIVAEFLAEPIPKNPNDPKNPPATYWQARHEIWVNGGEGWARWALKEITGKELRTVREWDEFLKANKKEYDK